MPDSKPDPRVPRTVLFVCLGNICRSPVAEALLRRRLDERGLRGRYRIHSAGIIARGGDTSPDDAIRAAAELGVDLRTHLSTRLTAEHLTAADLVVAMDRSNVEHILDLVPDLGSKLILLKQYAPGARGFDVPDPMGRSIEIYRDSYRQIALGVGGLVVALEGNTPPDEAGSPPP